MAHGHPCIAQTHCVHVPSHTQARCAQSCPHRARAPAQTCPGPDGVAGAVAILSHCPRSPLQAALAEISRVLRPGGVLVASTFLTPLAPLGELLGDDAVRPLVQVRAWLVGACVGRQHAQCACGLGTGAGAHSLTASQQVVLSMQAVSYYRPELFS